MKLFKGLIPFLYGALFIVLPIAWFKTNYIVSVLLFFVIPSILLFVLLYTWIKKNRLLRAFWINTAVMIVITTIFEYVALYLDIWSFSEEIDHLLGIEIAGAPVEEFVFWYFASPFCMLVYFYYVKIIRGERYAACS